MWTQALLLGAMGLAGGGVVGCAQERPPINQVQADALAKSFFVGADLKDISDDPEFYMRGTVVDVGYGAAQDGLFTSTYAQPVSRVRWEVTEDYLNARLSYERIAGTDAKGNAYAGVQRKTANDGQIVASNDRRFDQCCGAFDGVFQPAHVSPEVAIVRLQPQNLGNGTERIGGACTEIFVDRQRRSDQACPIRVDGLAEEPEAGPEDRFIEALGWMQPRLRQQVAGGRRRAHRRAPRQGGGRGGQGHPRSQGAGKHRRA
jgi:hypothetical protein